MKFGEKEIAILLVLCVGFIAAFPLDEEGQETGGRSKRVWNGTNAKLGQFPYAAQVRRWGFVLCSGSLISELAGLTALHCIPDGSWKGNKTIFTRAYDMVLGIVEAGQPITVAKAYVVHLPESELYLDIAILNFAEPVQLSEFVKPVAVSGKPLVYEEGALVYNAGWGYSHDPIKRLNYQEMTIVKNKRCEIYGGDFTTPYRICTRHSENEVCSGLGDSGSPLVMKRPEGDVQLGVLSAMGYCGTKFPEIYASTSWSVDWIREKAEGNVTFVEVE